MDLYQLKAFYILARVGSFTETAAILFVTQSAVSHSIKKLEKSVDTQLILRKGKQFELTEAGETLLRSCETIFHEIEKVNEELIVHQKKAQQTVKIGAPAKTASPALAWICITMPSKGDFNTNDARRTDNSPITFS